ncbi:damage-control phosphatase, subfamily III, partial [Tremellales sp. Uapishka_1]
MVQLFHAPVERYSPKDKQSFSYVVLSLDWLLTLSSYTTVTKRWPVILTNIVSSVVSVNHTLSTTPSHNSEEQLAEGKIIIAKLSALKHDMGRNTVLTPIEDDGGSNVACYNEELALIPDEEKRWFTINWLFAECYLYRRIRNFFAMTQHWTEFDPFFASKSETYKSSSAAILHLAKSINSLSSQPDLAKDYDAPGSPLEIAFMEMVQADLWGNATDLSLLVDLKYEDLQKLQAVGAKAQAEQSKMILRNDLDKVWKHLKTVKDGRVDIVLDNGERCPLGFSIASDQKRPSWLYTDFILADFLVSHTPFVSQVVFHPKTIPWFVSDVLPYDFTWAVETLKDASFFSTAAAFTASDVEEVELLADRWQGHLDSGRFKLSVPLDTKLGAITPLGDFWTTQFAYQDLPVVDPELLSELRQSDLVLFKGDLNYRKLIGDAKWPVTTPFEDALGPLAGKFNLLSLRTNKADTIYAVVSFSPRQ